MHGLYMWTSGGSRHEVLYQVLNMSIVVTIDTVNSDDGHWNRFSRHKPGKYKLRPEAAAVPIG